jgi:predicted esterase
VGGSSATSCATGALCDGKIGLCAPDPLCTAADPCGKNLFSPAGTKAPLNVPACKTTSPTRMAFSDAPPLTWTDPANGDARAACVYEPPGTSATSRRPLVLWLHGAGGSADGIYNATLMRQKASTFDLSGDPARPGFVLIADQGRNVHDPNPNLEGTHHENYYRDTSTPSSSPDFRALDRLIDDAVATRGADPDRIYVVGWSNGAYFGALYALGRNAGATPGGNHVAAAAFYDGADPYAGLSSTESPSCQGTYPTSTVPIFMVHRNCDIVACNEAQREALKEEPGRDVLGWIATLRGTIGDPNVRDVILDPKAAETSSCAPVCSEITALTNHLHWPDGIWDGSGVDWELEMLGFLRDHPRLPAQ